MNCRHYLILFMFGLGSAVFSAAAQKAPGYMDADYYLMGGMRLAAGHGFSELVLWNYLDNPAGFPHPSHAYWMPLPSIFAAAGIWLTPSNVVNGGRILFILLAALVPPVTCWLSWTLFQDHSERSRQGMAFFSGALAIFSGFYLQFMTMPDAFALYMLLGAILIALLHRLDHNDHAGIWLGMGIAAGLMHLSRADGFIWLGVALLGTAVSNSGGLNRRLLRVGGCLAGYSLIMGPWYFRNISVFGTPLAPGGLQTLWLLQYDELFSYPASILTFERWWAAGLGEILRARLWALGLNLQTTLGVQGQVFLLPLMVWGLWSKRANRAVRLAIAGWFLTLLLMSMVFPFSGARGGFFHSGAAVQSLFWAAVPAGLDAFVAWGGRVRRWRIPQAKVVFQWGVVVLAVLMTGFVFTVRVIQRESSFDYRMIEQKILEWEANASDVVMVNNPPKYYVETGRMAVVIPNGDVTATLQAAKRYQVRFILLDENIPAGIMELYRNPESGTGLQYLGEVDRVKVFEVIQ